MVGRGERLQLTALLMRCWRGSENCRLNNISSWAVTRDRIHGSCLHEESKGLQSTYQGEKTELCGKSFGRSALGLGVLQYPSILEVFT